MKRTVLIGATCAVLGGAGVAGAQTTHILGRDGPTVPLDAMCHREVSPAPGETLEMSVNVIGQQVHCLIRRPDPSARCVEKLGEAPPVEGKFDHGPSKLATGSASTSCSGTWRRSVRVRLRASSNGARILTRIRTPRGAARSRGEVSGRLMRTLPL